MWNITIVLAIDACKWAHVYMESQRPKSRSSQTPQYKFLESWHNIYCHVA